MKLVYSIWGRKSKNPGLIPSEDLLIFGLHPRIPDNFILSAPPKIILAGTPVSVRNSAYSDMANPILNKKLKNFNRTTSSETGWGIGGTVAQVNLLRRFPVRQEDKNREMKKNI